MKLMICIALHLYSGPIDPSSPVTELAASCKETSINAATKAIQKCSAEGPLVCEVIVSADKKRVTLERKVSITTHK